MREGDEVGAAVGEEVSLGLPGHFCVMSAGLLAGAVTPDELVGYPCFADY